MIQTVQQQQQPGIMQGGKIACNVAKCSDKLEDMETQKTDDLSALSLDDYDTLKEKIPSVDEEKSEALKKVCEMIHLVGTPVLEQVLESRLPVDTVLVCSDGKIGAHRIVLTAVSPFMGLMFEDHKLGDVTTLIMPDISRSTMETLLHLAYTGRMIFPPEKEEDVFAAMECLLFGQTAQLELSMVQVKKQEPPPPPPPEPSTLAAPNNNDEQQASSSSALFSTNPSSHTTPLARLPNGMRKRRLSGTSDDSSSIHSEKGDKKVKYDQNGRRIQVAFRTGEPIGKEGAQKLQKKREKVVVNRGLNICSSPPRFTSNPETKTVRLNLKKLPVISIRLQRLRGPVCVEPSSDNPKPRYLGKTKHKKGTDCGTSRPSSRASNASSCESTDKTATLDVIHEEDAREKQVSPPASTVDDTESGFGEPDHPGSSPSSGQDSSEDRNDLESPPRSPPDPTVTSESSCKPARTTANVIRLRSGMLCLGRK